MTAKDPIVFETTVRICKENSKYKTVVTYASVYADEDIIVTKSRITADFPETWDDLIKEVQAEFQKQMRYEHWG